jgi:hypothetical protein
MHSVSAYQTVRGVRPAQVVQFSPTNIGGLPMYSKSKNHFKRFCNMVISDSIS